MKRLRATRKQTAYLAAIQRHMESELITAATFRKCGCIRAEIGGVLRYVECEKCARLRERHQRMSRDIPRSCYCGQVDEWCEQTAAAFASGDLERAEHYRKLRMEHRCEARDIEDAHRWPEAVT